MVYQAGRTDLSACGLWPHRRLSSLFSKTEVFVGTVSVESVEEAGVTVGGVCADCCICAISCRMRASLVGVVGEVLLVGVVKREGNRVSMRSFRHFFASVGIMAVHVGMSMYGFVSVDRKGPTRALRTKACACVSHGLGSEQRRRCL